MKVILLEDVKSIGKKGQILEVKEGYAHNFLLPNKKAVIADNVNLRKLNKENELKKQEKEKNKENAEKIANILKNEKIVFEKKAGHDGKLFGSITAKEISDALAKDKKILIDRKKIDVEHNISAVGEYTIKIKLSEGVIATLQIIVKGI